MAPHDGTASYDIEAPSPTLTVTTYVLTATSIAGGRMAGDTCGIFSLNNFGQKGPDGSQDDTLDPGLMDTCWGR